MLFRSAFVVFAVRASHLNMSDFIEVMPLIPLVTFAVVILGFVILAYYIGGRKIYRSGLAEVLRDDALI